MGIYDVSGTLILNDKQTTFNENIDVDYEFDSASNANYSVIRIYKTKTDGTKQYPFSRTKGLGSLTYSALDLANEEKWLLTSNAWGVGNDGIVIENGVVLRNTPSANHSGALPLTIDSNGDLGYAAADADADALVASGIVSTVPGFCPIIINYLPATLPQIGNAEHLYDGNAQRKIIGQFGNGDYAIITCEGRDYDHSDGWTIAEAQTICQKLGLKFAFNMDGGGSVETVLGQKQLNTIYEGTTGRKVPLFIVFNGTDTFSVPNS